MRGRDAFKMTVHFTQSRLTLPDAELATYSWMPAHDPRAVLLILHGMGDHGRRYDRFARYLAGHGFAVRAHDHRGHGLTGHRSGQPGHFADQNGWNLVVRDVSAHLRELREVFPDQPMILMGHSMGSFIAQECLIRHGDKIDGVILSGSSGGPTIASRLAYAVATLDSWVRGGRAPARLLDQLSTYLFNRPFHPTLTLCDWLSRDPEEVRRYLNDPLCQFTNTVQLWIDVLAGIKECSKLQRQQQIPNTLPIYLFGGAQDPMSAQGHGVHALAESYQASGLSEITTQLYPGGRHEMLNEINRDEVHADLLQWLSRQW